jgi:hypothetical protein
LNSDLPHLSAFKDAMLTIDDIRAIPVVPRTGAET